MGGVLPDGTRVVVRNAWDRANVDAEQISHAIAARLGANVPALVRTGPNQTVQVMLSGQSAEDNESAWHLAARRHPEQVRDLAILDEITYNTDRHLANVWIDEEGNIFGIDQANRLPRRVRPTYTPFGEFLDVFQEVPMTLAEVDRALVALADVRELAESLGRAREWEAMRERIQKRRDLVVG